MAIEKKRMQQRYGTYDQFQADKQNLLPNEFASVTSGDPNSVGGKALYFAFGPGDAKRLMTAEDAEAIISNATKEATEAAEQAKKEAETASQNAQEALEETQNLANTVQQQIETEGQQQIDAIEQAGADQIEDIQNASIEQAEKIAIKPTAEGNPISVTDSAEWRLQDFEADGWTEQTVTEGKNLLDLNNATLLSCTLVNAENGSIKSSVNGSKYYCAIKILYLNDYIVEHLGEDITFSVADNPSGKNISIVIYGDGPSSGMIEQSIIGNEVTLTISNEFTSVESVEVRCNRQSETFTDTTSIIKNLMLNLGSEALPYEPYSGGYPSPRPEIRTNQLFDASKLPTKSQGGATVTNNEDGSFTISGEGNLTETFSHGYDYTHSDLVNFFREGKLYLDVGVITTPYVYFNVKKQGQNLINANNELREKVEVTITKEILDDPETTFRIGFYGTQGSEITPQIIYPMLYQDGDGAWEPYGTVEAWPQPIVSAAEDAKTEEGEYPVTFSITGKNLINFYKYYNSFSGSDGYEGSANEINQIKINLPKSLIGKQVCFSAKIKISGNLTGSYVYAITGGIGKCGNIIRNKNVFEISKVIFTPKTEEDTIHITYGTNGANTVYFKDLMLNLGEEAGFEPYKNPQTVTITSDRPLTKWDRMEKRDGKWGWVYKSEEVEFDGSEDEGWNYTESYNYITAKNGTKNYDPNKVNIFCNKLIGVLSTTSTSLMKNYSIKYGNDSGTSNAIIMKIDSEITSLDGLKAWLQSNPLKVLYETESEEWVELQREEQDALNTLTTYYPTTVIQNDAGMEMAVKYVADPKNYLDQHYQAKLDTIDAIATRVAALEDQKIKEV